MTDQHSALKEEAGHLAQQLLGNNVSKCAAFTDRLLDICTRAQGKDFLLIHNPGGWGNRPLKHCLEWERSIVEGISATLGRLGYSWLQIQYFRTGRGWRELVRDAREQSRFFPAKATIMAAELKFITHHLNTITVLMIGVSQGAAFSNAVLQRLAGLERIGTIELGVPFIYESRRVVDGRTMAVDGNGLMPDALMEWDVLTILRTYVAAPFRWLGNRLRGKPVKFARCINVRGHDYNWEYPEVRGQIGDFLETNFGPKSNPEVEVS